MNVLASDPNDAKIRQDSDDQDKQTSLAQRFGNDMDFANLMLDMGGDQGSDITLHAPKNIAIPEQHEDTTVSISRAKHFLVQIKGPGVPLGISPVKMSFNIKYCDPDSVQEKIKTRMDKNGKKKICRKNGEPEYHLSYKSDTAGGEADMEFWRPNMKDFFEIERIPRNAHFIGSEVTLRLGTRNRTYNVQIPDNVISAVPLRKRNSTSTSLTHVPGLMTNIMSLALVIGNNAGSPFLEEAIALGKPAKGEHIGNAVNLTIKEQPKF